LSAHGAKDLLTMERRSDPAAPPSLVIVVDEFAALATEVPEFLDGVIDVAQRGRSLGLHLVLATQRPAGVITDNLRANTNLRIALRMADETDSSDVIGVHDAAFFAPETPGRGAIKVGPGRITHFQTGYLGGRAGGETRAPEIEVRSLGFTEGEPWAIPVSSPRVPPGSDAAPAMPSPDAASGSATGSATGSAAGLAAAQKPPRDIERLRDGVQHAATQASIASPRRPWLDELPQLLRLGALTQQAQQAQQAQHRGVPGDAPLLGMLDDPAAQSQMPEAIDFEAIGNLSLLGAGGTGKTSALLTLVASLNADPVRSPVQVYAIDAAGGSLDALRSLPTVGAVAPSNDAELTLRVLRHLIGLIAERGPRYAAARAANLSGYRAANPLASPDPRVFLLLDGFSAFQQSADSFPGADSPLDLLSEIMTAGRAVGVHAVLTSDRPSAIPAGLASTVQLQLVLRLSNENDYGYAGVDAEALAGAPAGRAVRPGDPREIQIALAFAVTPDESTESGASDGRPARLIGLSEQALA
ncbi:MAG: cell division protein FtsK, partial [Actinobacteria bacterium]|nr:cell division protein FtsK [Actinomycetota bacterium]